MYSRTMLNFMVRIPEFSRDSWSLLFILTRFRNMYQEEMRIMILVRVLMPKRSTETISVTHLKSILILTSKMASWFKKVVCRKV